MDWHRRKTLFYSEFLKTDIFNNPFLNSSQNVINATYMIESINTNTIVYSQIAHRLTHHERCKNKNSESVHINNSLTGSWRKYKRLLKSMHSCLLIWLAAQLVHIIGKLLPSRHDSIKAGPRRFQRIQVVIHRLFSTLVNNLWSTEII